MKFYFESKERQEKLKTVLESWEGTPHKHKGRVKGKAVDCINLVGMVLVETGVIRKFYVIDYAPDWHLHKSRELLLEGIMEQTPSVQVDPMGPLMNGDVLLFQYGRASAHSAIYFDDYVYQSFNRQRVRKANLKHQKDRLKYAIRMVEK